MIIRQFCARHGRTVISRSSRSHPSCFASSIAADDRRLRPSVGEIQGERSVTTPPDAPSSILDTTSLPPTPRTRAVHENLQSTQSSIDATQLDLNAHSSALTGGVSADPNELTFAPHTVPNTAGSSEALRNHRRQKRKAAKVDRTGSDLTGTYNPSTLINSPPTPEALTLPDLLANQTHLGHHTSLWHPGNSSYIYGIRAGIHIISLDQTYAYLQRAAKIIRNVAYRGGLILFIGTRPSFTPIVTTAARRAHGYHIFDRWVPGTLTNGQQLLSNCAVHIVDVNDNPITTYEPLLSKRKHSVIRPDLVVCLNPLENEVALHECGLNTVPTIGIIDTDTNPSWVTYPIPANDDSLRSVALVAGVLSQAARQGQEARLQEAKDRGEATYDTRAVMKWLERAQELDEIDATQSQGRTEEPEEAEDKEQPERN